MYVFLLHPRHYSSGESSPELPVLSKVRYRGGPAQKKVNPPSPTGSPTGYNSGEEYDGSIVYFDPEVGELSILCACTSIFLSFFPFL